MRSSGVSQAFLKRFMRFSTYASAFSDVSLVGVSLLSADVAIAVVMPEVISQRRSVDGAFWGVLKQRY
jgi:hypothetical protein